jgi:ATP synthase protein I
MNEESKAKGQNEGTNFTRQVGAQAARKRKALRGAKKTIWFGLGMSGIIGWSVAGPIVVGAAVGIWVDKRYPSTLSWTLMLLCLGLVIGCFNAWQWVDSQYKEMQEEKDE